MKSSGFLGQNLGLNVERLRCEQELTKAALALMSGVSRPFLDKVESGSSNPQLSYVRQLAEALCVNPLDLLDSEDERA